MRVAGNPAAVRAQQEGRLTAIAAREGAFVEQGTVLFRLDDATTKMDVARLETEIDRARQTITLLQSQREPAFG